MEGPAVGSIPACAGEPTRSTTRCSDGDSLSPRVRGNLLQVGVRLMRMKGLSPRVRGNRNRIDFFKADLGSIPACAGEPGAGQRRTAPGRVYPRVCGGTMKFIFLHTLFEWVYPRVCGGTGRAGGSENGRLTRSIPACAGEPGVARHDLFVSSGLSPRVRGNRRCGWLPRPCLSPRVRGNLPCRF